MTKHSNEYFDNNFVITQTCRLFDRTESGKSWKKKPSEESTQVISGYNYNCALTWIGTDRVSYGYTYAGYLPVHISSVSPGGYRKAVWTYSFNLKR